MHHAFSLIFHIQYFLPGINFAAFEEVKVPVSNSAEFFQKSGPMKDFGGFGVVRVKFKDVLPVFFYSNILQFAFSCNKPQGKLTGYILS